MTDENTLNEDQINPTEKAARAIWVAAHQSAHKSIQPIVSATASIANYTLSEADIDMLAEGVMNDAHKAIDKAITATTAMFAAKKEVEND